MYCRCLLPFMLLALDAGWYPLPPPPPPPPRCPVGPGDDTHTLGMPACTLCRDDDPVDRVDLDVIVVAPVEAEDDSELSLCSICGTRKGEIKWFPAEFSFKVGRGCVTIHIKFTQP